MTLNQRFWVSSSLLLFLALSVYSFPSTFLSDRIFDSQAHTGRNLLQAKQPCGLLHNICTGICIPKEEFANISLMECTKQATDVLTNLTCLDCCSSVNFEFANYTIITSKCKAPAFTPKDCCGALKEFACPYADVLNDLSNDCAAVMFSYINIYGKYPPGLFAHECREGKLGLECPALPPSVSADDTGNQIIHYPSLLMMLTACLLILLF